MSGNINRHKENMNDSLVRAAEILVKQIEPHAAIAENDKKSVLKLLRMWKRSLGVVLGQKIEHSKEKENSSK